MTIHVLDSHSSGALGYLAATPESIAEFFWRQSGSDHDIINVEPVGLAFSSILVEKRNQLIREFELAGANESAIGNCR